MTPIRLLALGQVPALRSQAIYHAVAETAAPDDPPTLCVLSPDRPYVSIGYHQEAAREIDLGFCRDSGIPVVRRQVGGGAVLLDADQLFFHLVVPRDRRPDLALPLRIDRCYTRLISPALAAYRRLGINAVHRPPNDIAVGGRKIGGTGMAEIEDSLVFVGSLMRRFDAALMARVLRIDDDPVRAAVARSIAESVTSIERETGRAPAMEAVEEALLAGFREALDVELVPGRLSAAEEERIAAFEKTFASDAWLHHISWHGERPRKLVIQGGLRYVEAERATPAGRLRMALRVAGDRVEEIFCAGDLAARAGTAVDEVRSLLLGAPVAGPDLAARLASPVHRGINGENAAADEVSALARALLEAAAA